MSVVVTIRRIGSSLGIILPKALVVRKGLHEKDQVEIDPKPVRDIRELKGVLRRWGTPSAAVLNRLTNEGEEL